MDGHWVCPPPVGYSVFVVGVADVDMTELRIIGSKPSERHVFVVDDYDAFAKIQDNLITFICETATSSKDKENQTSLLLGFCYLSLVCELPLWFD